LSAIPLVLALTATKSAQAQDRDGDGVPDAADAYPCDPATQAKGFVPAEGQHALALFEDQWPSDGDLDFNDVVVTYNFVFRQNMSGQVLGLRLTLNALASGGW
jgi:hypothetical protein